MIVGLGMLYFSSFAKVKYTGPTIALSLAVALLAALTLAPACCSCSARGDLLAVPRPTQARRRRIADSRTPTRASVAGFWVRVADLVVAYPLADPRPSAWSCLPLWPSSGLAPSRTTTS